MNGKIKRRIVLFNCLFFTLFTLSAHGENLLKEAEQLINSNQHQAAFDLLMASAERNAGNPNFDLLLGIAAINSGHPTMAVFAFERVLAVDPGNARARAELGRAYFDMGENEAAKQELTAVNREQIHPALSKAIEKYLTAIEDRFASESKRTANFIEISAGYDSNVNGATDISTVAIPALGNLLFTINRNGRELGSGFFSLGVGTVFTGPLGKRQDLRIFGKASLKERITFHETDFNTRLADGEVGLGYTWGKNQIRTSIQGQRFYLGGDTNREQAGVGLQWLYSKSNRTQFSTFAQAVIQRYPDQPFRDVNQFSGGLGLVHAPAIKGAPIFFISTFAGIDDESESLRPDIGRTFAGLRSGGEFRLNERAVVTGNISYQYSRYGGNDPLFRERRIDHFVFSRLGLGFYLTRQLLIQPEIQYTWNKSSLVINDFDSWQALVTLRNNF